MTLLLDPLAPMKRPPPAPVHRTFLGALSDSWHERPAVTFAAAFASAMGVTSEAIAARLGVSGSDVAGDAWVWPRHGSDERREQLKQAYERIVGLHGTVVSNDEGCAYRTVDIPALATWSIVMREFDDGSPDRPTVEVLDRRRLLCRPSKRQDTEATRPTVPKFDDFVHYEHAEALVGDSPAVIRYAPEVHADLAVTRGGWMYSTRWSRDDTAKAILRWTDSNGVPRPLAVDLDDLVTRLVGDHPVDADVSSTKGGLDPESEHVLAEVHETLDAYGEPMTKENIATLTSFSVRAVRRALIDASERGLVTTHDGRWWSARRGPR